MKHRIYISPANHYKNYAIKGYTEKQQMDLLAPMLKAELEQYEDVDVCITTIYNRDRQYTGRPADAKKWGATHYIALHTNASGMSATNGPATGACGFYHPDFPESKAMAIAVVKNLNAICPIKSNRAAQPAIYAWSKTNWNFGELREPAKLKICPLLIEHEFHDRVDCAKWIIENLTDIAKADAKAIAEVLKLKLKKTVIVGDVTGDKKVDTLDAVAVLKYDAGLTKLTEDQKLAADVNGDGKIDSLDATLILKHDAGLIDLNKDNSTSKTIVKGSTVKVKASATRYGTKAGSKIIPAFVKQRTYTVYNIVDGQVLIGINNSYTGWVNIDDVEVV